MKKKSIYLPLLIFILLVLFCPAVAHANGGGPLLLLLNAGIFIFGQVWIVISEIAIYKHFAKLGIKESIFEVVLINLLSTIVVGIGFPFILAVIGFAGSFFPEPLGPFLFLIGTWVADKVPYNVKYLPYVMTFGFLTTFFLTVYFEAWCLNRYWKKKNIQTAITDKKLSWISNSVSYAGLIILTAIYYFFAK